MKLKRTTVILPEQVKKDLKYVAADQDISFTMAVTAAVLYFLNDYKAGKVESEFFEQVKDQLSRTRGSEE